MVDTSKDQAYREEAARLALLDRQTQIDLVQMQQNLSTSARLSAAEREAAGHRADALERLLRLTPRKR